MTTTITTISIFRNGVWAGDGRIDKNGYIVDCAAVLGPDQDASDETYEAIEDAFTAEPQDAGRYTGEGSIIRPDGEYEWVIDQERATDSHPTTLYVVEKFWRGNPAHIEDREFVTARSARAAVEESSLEEDTNHGVAARIADEDDEDDIEQYEQWLWQQEF